MTTKHTHAVVFGRKVAGCPRCDELNAGAPTIQWRGSLKREMEKRFALDVRNHDCKKAGCGPVCTFGEW